jgi:hypothetical protein
MCNSFTISVIRPIVFSAILSSMIKLKSIMVHVQRTVLSSNTSPLTFNSLESFAILIEPSMSVVLDTESV